MKELLTCSWAAGSGFVSYHMYYTLVDGRFQLGKLIISQDSQHSWITGICQKLQTLIGPSETQKIKFIKVLGSIDLSINHMDILSLA